MIINMGTGYVQVYHATAWFNLALLQPEG